MDTNDLSPRCQITSVQKIPENSGLIDFAWHVKHRLEFAAYRRWKFVLNSLNITPKAKSGVMGSSKTEKLMPGDYVQVKSREEISATLNAWDELKGCAFMDEMTVYCGTEQRVFKRVEKFMDERDYRVKRATGIVLLENVICQGTRVFGRCDRSCFFFWREEWLERIGDKI